MKTWKRGRFWFDIWNPFTEGWDWSFHSLPCCYFFLICGFFCITIGTHSFDAEDDDEPETR